MKTLLNEDEVKALESKRSIRQPLSVSTFHELAHPGIETLGWTPASLYKHYSTGTLNNIASIRLSWVSPDYFSYIPRTKEPFSFRRSIGDEIEPRHMFTDGGTIPWLITGLPGLSRWGYAPAYLVHDWLFDAHHCQSSDLSFETVRDIMMEAVKTMMDSGLVERNEWIFLQIYVGISSGTALALWDKEASSCPLPPDYSE